MVAFHFFSHCFLFIFLCQVAFCHFGAVTWRSSLSTRKSTKAGAGAQWWEWEEGGSSHPCWWQQLWAWLIGCMSFIHSQILPLNFLPSNISPSCFPKFRCKICWMHGACHFVSVISISVIRRNQVWRQRSWLPFILPTGFWGRYTSICSTSQKLPLARMKGYRSN